MDAAPLERLSAAVAGLGDADRALLELHVKGTSPELIADVARVERSELERRHRHLLDRIATELDADAKLGRDQVAVLLARVPESAWRGAALGRPEGGAGLAASLIVKLRYVVVALWVAAAAFVTVQLPSIGEAQVGALGDLVPNEAEAFDAELASARLFRFPLISRTLIVQRDADGLSAVEQGRVARRAVGLTRGEYGTRAGGALPVTNTLGRPPFSRERSTTAITYLFFPTSVDRFDRGEIARRFVVRAIEPEYDGFVGVTGTLSAREQQSELIVDRLPAVEIATVLLVALVIGGHFRALAAPLGTLVAVAIAYLISTRLIAWIGLQAGVSVPREVEPVIVVLLFGVVTDYSIFFLSRVRRRMAEGEDSKQAALRGSAELLPIIVTAGLTVVGATASLLVARLGFFQTFGPGLALSILFGLLVAVTFVPALLAIGGRWLFWPSRPGVELTAAQAAEETPTEERGRPARTRAIGIATRWPLATVLASAALLLAAASGLFRLDLGNPLIRGLPPDSPPREAYAAATRGFAPGILSPTVAVVSGPGIVLDREALSRLQRLLSEQPGVAQVVGPADQPARREFGAVLSETGDAARYFVVFETDPLGARAVRDLRRIRDRMPAMLREAGVPRARPLFAGDTALVAETIEKTVDDIGRVAPTAVAVVFLILAVFLRALVAPLYLLAASVLALLASLGLATYFFQGVLGYDGLNYFVPFAAAVLLVSLGSDYNVFIAGRIWAEARRRPLREAVAVAGARAARPITVAGLVLAGSFALLWIVPIRAFHELAFTMAVGLLIDAFLVRTLLVPALITLVGPPSGWPGSRLRRAAARARARRAATPA